MWVLGRDSRQGGQREASVPGMETVPRRNGVSSLLHVLPSNVSFGVDLSPCAGSWSWESCPLSLSRVAGQSVQGSKFKPVKVSGGWAERSLVSDTGTRPRPSEASVPGMSIV